MPARNSTIRRLVAEAGAAARWGEPARAAAARRDLAAERLASYVERIVAEAPPLTVEQRARITDLLRPADEPVA